MIVRACDHRRTHMRARATCKDITTCSKHLIETLCPPETHPRMCLRSRAGARRVHVRAHMFTVPSSTPCCTCVVCTLGNLYVDIICHAPTTRTTCGGCFMCPISHTSLVASWGDVACVHTHPHMHYGTCRRTRPNTSQCRDCAPPRLSRLPLC